MTSDDNMISGKQITKQNGKFAQKGNDFFHRPVLLSEVLTELSPRDGGIYIDCSFGMGGYSSAILAAADCHLFAIDRDDSVQPYANAIARCYDGFRFFHSKFSRIEELFIDDYAGKIDGIVVDFGVSSIQLDDYVRGFSFNSDSPLGMCMGINELSAADIINTYSEEQLADIFFHLGQEPKARQIAKRIIFKRNNGGIKTCRELASLVGGIYKSASKKNPATKIFQALRIEVNNEISEIEKLLNAVPKLLMPNGKFIAVNFHSLEDLPVKNFIKEHSKKNLNAKNSGGINYSKYLPLIDENQGRQKIQETPNDEHGDEGNNGYVIIQNKIITPSHAEIQENPRSRSAKMRVAEFAIKADDCHNNKYHNNKDRGDKYYKKNLKKIGEFS